MNNESRSGFSLEDIRTIRYLVLVMGGIGVFMLLVTDRETPIVVVSFIAVVTVVPIGAIYLIRRVSRRKRPNKSPEPTPGSVTPRAIDQKSK